MEPKVEVFQPITAIEEFEINIGDEYAKKIYFSYSGKGDTIFVKLSGNPATTGLQASKIVYEPDGTYSVRIYGIAKIINKNTLTLRLKDNLGNVHEFPFVFFVNPLKINPSTLPEAIGLFKPYTTKIFFQNPSKRKPKFGYNFPLEFGFVKTNFDDGLDYTTITFNPSKAGKFKFLIEALADDTTENPNKEKNILLGYRTMNITIVDDSPKVVAGKLDSVKSVDIKDWK